MNRVLADILYTGLVPLLLGFLLIFLGFKAKGKETNKDILLYETSKSDKSILSGCALIILAMFLSVWVFVNSFRQN
jgi:hypothetical protein